MGARTWQTVSFDWNQARAFLVTAEEGSLSAAARALGLTQPTLGRQVAALEASLGVTLFERVGRGLTLTETGLELLEHARAMGEAATRMSLGASGRSRAIEGQVCITASDLLSVYELPAVLERLGTDAPGIDVEVVASNEIRDLKRREADIAIRHVRPEQPDLIARHVHDSTAHLYAAPAYLQRHGRPSTRAELADAVFVGVGEIERYVANARELDIPISRANVKYTSDSGLMSWEMVKRGLGMTLMWRGVADRTPEVEQVLPELEPVPVPIWLVTHRELRTSPRIRLVFDVLAQALAGRRGSPRHSRVRARPRRSRRAPS